MLRREILLQSNPLNNYDKLYKTNVKKVTFMKVDTKDKPRKTRLFIHNILATGGLIKKFYALEYESARDLE